MAHPVDAARNTTSVTSGSGEIGHSINVGSPVAGTLLIVFVRFPSNPGSVTFTGYTVLQSLDFSDDSDDRTIVYYRLANGSEGATDLLSTGNFVKSCAICWEITGAADPADQAPEKSTIATGTTAANTCNPGSVTPTGGSNDYLFLSLGGMDGESNFTGAPSSYSDLVVTGTGTTDGPETNSRIAGASRQLTASSENPGTFSHPGANAGWTALTVAIHPGSQEFFGQVITPFTFGRVTAGKAQKESSVVTPFSFDSVVSGNVVGQHFGSVSQELTFESEVNGRRVVSGQVNSPFTLGITTRGEGPPGEFEGEPTSPSNLSLTPLGDSGLSLTPLPSDGLTLDPID